MRRLLRARAMRARHIAATCIACFPLLTGCYRSAKLAPESIASIDHVGEARLVVRGTDGSRRVFQSYDTVEVEAAIDGGQRRIRGPLYEFTRPVVAQAQPGGLVVRDLYTDRGFQNARAVTVWDQAPERPWIIAAATVAAMLLGGALGYAAAGECHSDADMGCYDNAIYTGIGTLVGAGVGLGVSIPLTGSLHPTPSAE